MRVAIAWFGGFALLAQSAAALACGEQDDPHYVVSAQLPNGEGVALNAPLVVELVESPDESTEGPLSPSLTLVVASTDAAIELKANGGGPHLSWVPKQPLAPSTTYQARFNTGYEGDPDRTWQFTTGATTQPPLTLEGELSATLEAGTDPAYDCSHTNDCGGCVENGRLEVTKARLALPRLKGGFAGRVGELWLTDGTPHVFAEPSKDGQAATAAHEVSSIAYVSFDESGEPTRDVLLTLPEESEPYVPCFALRVTDDRDDGAAKSFCLDEVFPLSNPEPELTPIDDEPVRPDDETRSSSACGMGRLDSRQDESALVALGLLGVVLLRRAARSA